VCTRARARARVHVCVCVCVYAPWDKTAQGSHSILSANRGPVCERVYVRMCVCVCARVRVCVRARVRVYRWTRRCKGATPSSQRIEGLLRMHLFGIRESTLRDIDIYAYVYMYTYECVYVCILYIYI